MNLRACNARTANLPAWGGQRQRAAKLSRRPAFETRDRPLDAAQSSDPEVARLFQEAQQNILRLNQSRLKALSELKAARERINDLEGRLADAVAGAKVHTNGLNGNSYGGGNGNGASNGSHAHTISTPQAQAAPPQQLPPSGQNAPPPSITIAYGTGWNDAYIHYRTPNQDWTKVPGVRMERGSGDLEGSKVATISGCERVEFVLNNGGNDWDTPDPYGGGKKNYVVDRPGVYQLKAGRLHRLR